MRMKTCDARIKAVGEDVMPVEGTEDVPNDDGMKAGQFEAIVSAFGNVDAVGDVVEKGAFTKTLDNWKASGNPIPVIWSHDHGNPDAHIGVVDEAKETDAGLWVKGTIDLDEPYAAKVFKLMKGRRVTKFSFAYDVKDGTENDKGGFDLKELDLWEVGPTLIPANDATDLLAIKNLMASEDMSLVEFARMVRELKAMSLQSATLGAKAGRVLSSKNESVLKDAVAAIKGGLESINGVLKSVATDDGDDGKNDKPADKAAQPGDDNAPKGAEDLNPAGRQEQPAMADADLMTMLSIDSMLADL